MTTVENGLAGSLVQVITKTPPTRLENRLQTGTTTTLTVNVAALESDLRTGMRGEVRFGDGDRGMYASDAGNYRMAPIGVVVPKDADDVLHTLAGCRRHGAPIVARGGGTGIPGQSVNVAVLLDFSKYMNRITEMNPAEKYARVQPGIVLDELRKAANRYELTFGPDPATHSRNTLGGMIGNNSCGIHSMMAGETVDNIDELDIVTYDGTRMTVGATGDADLERIINEGGRRGEIYASLKALRDKYADRIRKEFPMIPRRVSGFNLPALLPEQGFHVARALVGTECTCALVLEAKTRLVHNPPARSLLVFGYPDIFAAADHVVGPAKFGPVGLEALDDTFIDYMKKKGLHPPNMSFMPEGDAWLLIEFGGETKGEADANARKCMDDFRNRGNPPSMKLFDDPQQERLVWTLREEGLGATAKVPHMPENHEGWEDSSVPPAKLGGYLRGLKKLMDKYQYVGPLYGHFGQGCVHTRLTFDLVTADGIRKWRSFLEEASDLVVHYGGSLSGEHGDGQARGELLARMYSPEIIEAFREFKSIWDPDWKMNPGKVVDPFRVDENLREGTNYNPPRVKTHFHFPEDHHSFAYASDRCVGAGVCRRLESEDQTMCPSYMVTREEKHSTRGRARLLNEMIRGEVVKGGWRDESVREALDLCLSCKGCKHDCPVQVDMATYKAEFLSHYYERRARPRYAYASGLIYWWSRAAAQMPATANFFTQTPGLSNLAKALGGYSQKRHLPPFAPETFRDWFARRPVRNFGQPQVMLWADTFNNHFTPNVAKAGVDVLEHAGYQVVLPPRILCCGRPLYDYGMLDTAKGLLLQILETIREPIRNGLPIVGLEPSCVTVFRDELPNLLYGNEDAKRLHQQTFYLSEFLDREEKNYSPASLRRKALVHGHCHQKSLLHFEGEVGLLRKAGLDCEVPPSGCCGMAGSFGYETDHYQVGLDCGERVLLPTVRSAANATLVVTDGFSCREMIRQETDRHALHFAQVLQMAIREGPSGPSGPHPEKNYTTLERTPALPAPVIGAGALLAGATLWWLRSKRGR
ncbi:MAG: FAD-binding and (Fe-S)-binding domain-containing protein [Bryobacteraceae bacterium]